MEFSAKQFYIHQRFLNVYYYIYAALEDWISKNIFRNDTSRVFLASDDFAFRRRFELTDMSQDFNQLDISHLRFPFANYWPLNSGWVPDHRTAANTAALVYDGIYENATKIRAISSIMSLPTTFYFDREDDARLAYEILYFKSFNEHTYSTRMPFGDDTLKIPVTMEIKNLNFNPSYTESDWLKNNRIFIIKADMELRSFAIQPPLQPDINLELNPDGYLSDGTSYEDGVSRYYLTNEVILNQKNYQDLVTSTLTVTGALAESHIRVDRLTVTNIDYYTAQVSWVLHQDSNVSRISIQLNNGKLDEVNPKATAYLFSELEPNSDYSGWITFFDEKNAPKRLGFTIITNGPVETKDAPKDALVGFSW